MNDIVFAQISVLGQGIGMAFLIGAVIFVGLITLIMKFYRKVEQGKALIVNKMTKEPMVTFTGAVVLPIVHKAEVMKSHYGMRMLLTFFFKFFDYLRQIFLQLFRHNFPLLFQYTIEKSPVHTSQTREHDYLSTLPGTL